MAVRRIRAADEAPLSAERFNWIQRLAIATVCRAVLDADNAWSPTAPFGRYAKTETMRWLHATRGPWAESRRTWMALAGMRRLPTKEQADSLFKSIGDTNRWDNPMPEVKQWPRGEGMYLVVRDMGGALKMQPDTGQLASDVLFSSRFMFEAEEKLQALLKDAKEEKLRERIRAQERQRLLL